MTPYGPQQPPEEQAMALPNPQLPASLSTFQLPQPQMPDLHGPGPATPPATLGGLPGAAPLPTEGNRIAQMRADLERRVAEYEQRAMAQRQAFEESMKTSSLERYLPKPSARQMLSDALANIGMAHLTKGNFTPIQQRRFDEALQAHRAEVESKKLALDSSSSAATQLNQMLTQARLTEALSEREATNQGKLAQAAAETERKTKADAANQAFKKAHDVIVAGRYANQNDESAAKTNYFNTLAEAKKYGSNDDEVAGKLLDSIDPEMKMEPLARAKKFMELRRDLRDAGKFQPSAGGGLIGGWQEDSDGNKHFLVGDKKTGAVRDTPVKPPEGTNGASWAKLTSTTRTMVEAAPTVLSFTNKIDKILDEQKGNLGPGNSRWREFWAGKVGAEDAPFTKLRSEVHLLVTNLMRMHVGSRGGVEIMKYFQDMINEGKQDPENLRTTMQVIREYAEEKMKHGGAPRNTPTPNPGGAKGGNERPPLSQFEVKQ